MVKVPGIIAGREIEVPIEIHKILEFDEKVLLAFQQAGIGGNAFGLESIFITNKRIIKKKPRTLGLRANITTYLYKDMANIKVNRGILRSNIGIKMRFMSEDVKIENIPRMGADKMCRVIQDGIAGRLQEGKPTFLPDAGISKPIEGITLPPQYSPQPPPQYHPPPQYQQPPAQPPQYEVKPEPMPQTQPPSVKPQIDTIEQIKKLAELKDANILTEEEFQAKKKELLSKI